MRRGGPNNNSKSGNKVHSPPPHSQPLKQTPFGAFLDEQSFINLLDHGSPSDQESALLSVRHATRSNNPDLRLAICTPALLSSLSPAILSSSLQSNAIAIVLNLSLEPPNRTRIVKSGILNLLIGLLKIGSADPDSKPLLVAALHSLSLEDKNRTTIGALGAVPPLVEAFLAPDQLKMARHDAGMAIYYLTFSSENRGRVIKTNSAIRRIVRVIKRDEEEEEIRSVGMRIACNLARCEEGRIALMEADAVAAMVSLVESASSQLKTGRESMAYMAAAAIYGMSKAKSLRFRSMAKMANAEEVLSRVLEERKNGAIREMVRKALMAIRGEGEEGEEQDEWYEYNNTGRRGAGTSEPVKRRHCSYGGNTAVSELDWMQ